MTKRGFLEFIIIEIKPDTVKVEAQVEIRKISRP
jgi:hypothetical protein